MNYQKIYDSLIKNAQFRIKPDCRTESHHIIPKSLGGSNNKSNLVDLTCREHCLAHLLLAKIYGGKMWYAINMMTNTRKMTSRAYSKAREEFAKLMSQHMKIVKAGANQKEAHPQWGTKASTETRKKQSLAKLGKNLGSKSHSFKGFIIATDIATGNQTKFAGNAELIKAGFQFQNVNHCINGKRKSHKGHTFKRVSV